MLQKPLLITIAIALSVILTACAPKQLTREESMALRKQYDQMRTKFYPDKTKDQVLDAVHELFTLADVDYQVVHEPNGCIAYRSWSTFVLIATDEGKDYWYITTQEKDNGTEIMIRQVGLQSGQGITYTGSMGGFQSVSSVILVNPSVIEIEEMQTRKPLYRLFYERLDFLLGLSDTWIDCPAAIDRVRAAHIYQSTINPLCWVASDRKPEGVE